MVVIPTAELRPLDDQIPATAKERQERFEATLRAVRIISDMAGGELPIYSADRADEITHEPGIFVLSKHLGTEQQIVDTTFDLKKMLLSGAADSAHSVIAGDLAIDYQNGERHDVSVAAKCYAKRTKAERFQRAMREVTIMEDLQNRGELTLEPIAVAIAHDQGATDGEVVLLTRYNPNLLSLDNIPWGRGVTDPTNVQNAIIASQALGRFNARLGYRHGDGKIKNAAVEYGRGAGMIDFETSRVFDVHDPIEASVTALDDFGLFIDSLEKKGFLKRDGLRETRDVINILGEEYLTEWSDASDAVQSAVAEQVTSLTACFDPANIADLR